MKIVYFGSSSFGLPSLEAVLTSRHELVHLFTQPARPTGRGKKLTPTDVKVWADSKNLPCSEAENINAPEHAVHIGSLGADALVVIAFGQFISSKIISLFAKGAINVHGSLLPRYRGAAPIHYAVMNGETETGITIITVVKRMDAGDMLAKASTPITPEDNAGTVHDRLANIAAPVLVETLDQLEAGTATFTPQDESQVTFAPKFTKADGLLDFHLPASDIYNKIRGLWPWPGAQTSFVPQGAGRSEPVILAQAEVVDSDAPADLSPGTLDAELNIVCLPGRLKIHRLKPAGKALMDFRDFVNGRHIRPGDVFTSVTQSENQR